MRTENYKDPKCFILKRWNKRFNNKYKIYKLKTKETTFEILFNYLRQQ